VSEFDGELTLTIEAVADPFVDYLGHLLLGIALDFPEACEPLGLDRPKLPDADQAHVEQLEDAPPENSHPEQSARFEGKHPWEKIPDLGYDRALLRLWHSERTAEEIASNLKQTDNKDLSRRRIYNRLWELRKEHGEEIVPKRR
jgi:hypothetical protein